MGRSRLVKWRRKAQPPRKANWNRAIRKSNRLIKEIRAQIGNLKEWIADCLRRGKLPQENNNSPKSPNLANLLDEVFSVQREKSRKYPQSWQHQHAPTN